MSLDELAQNEIERRAKRNIRDRLARMYLRMNPEIKENPELSLPAEVPEGTSEAAIRSIARHYAQQKQVRGIIRELN